MMNANWYQEQARTTAKYGIAVLKLVKACFESGSLKPLEVALSLTYTGLGLAGEAGEFADQAKRVIRDDGGELTPERRAKLIKELGDVLWYASAAASELGTTLEAVMQQNLDKLADRNKRNVISGEGER